jgi:hypothetical protein
LGAPKKLSGVKQPGSPAGAGAATPKEFQHFWGGFLEISASNYYSFTTVDPLEQAYHIATHTLAHSKQSGKD